MKKINILHILVDLIFLIVFNTIFFLFGTENYTAASWLSYVFIHIAYLMLIVSPYLAPNTKSKAVLGFPLETVSAVYFFTQLIVGVIIILINPKGFKFVLILEIIIAAVYMLVLLTNMIANEQTADAEERHEIELKYVKECSAQLSNIMSVVSDKDLKKTIEKAYDIIHSSQVRSNVAVRSVELEVINLIRTLRSQVMDSSDEAIETAKQIILMAEERNVQLKLSN